MRIKHKRWEVNKARGNETYSEMPSDKWHIFITLCKFVTTLFVLVQFKDYITPNGK
jgi:hypothetical protein